MPQQYQVPTRMERIPKKVKERVRELLNEGRLEDATVLLLAVSRKNHPNVDVVALMALAKAMDMIEKLGIEQLTTLADAKIIKMTPTSYVIEEAIRWAKQETGKGLDQKEMKWIKDSLLETVAKMLKDK